MSITSIFKNLKIVFVYVKNPISSLLVYFNLKNNTTCKLKNNLGNFHYSKKNKYILGSVCETLEKIYSCNDKNKLENFKNFVNQIDNDIINIDGIKFKNKDIGVLFERFDNPYELENLEGRIVIDIGANIGDTALEFAKNGAKEIYAFEPLKPIYDLANENINLNPDLKNNIFLYNKAISDENGVLTLYYDKGYSLAANSFEETNDSFDVESMTLDKMLENYDIKPDMLKIDCEGCEFDIIKSSDLSMFNDIQIEYHSSLTNLSRDIITNSLKEQGFNIQIQQVFGLSLDEIGIIHAFKNNKN